MIRNLISYPKGIFRGDHAYMNNKYNWYLFQIIDFFRSLYAHKKEKTNLDNAMISISTERLKLCVDKSTFSLNAFLDNKFYWPKAFLEINKLNLEEKGELYNEIKSNGFKSQKELKNNIKNDEVMAIINSNGQYILINGFKRLMVARSLKIEKIPIKVVKRHKNWVKFKSKVKNEEHQSGVYQQVLHPDFYDIAFHRKGDVRWDLINDSLQINKGTVLDIGSNWGYFSHKFEDLGYECTAVERNYKCNYFLKKFKDIEGKNFSTYNNSIFKIPNLKYDVVLALSIFHGFIRNKSAYDKMTELLSKLDMEYMYFEPHKGDEVGDGFYVNYKPEEFVEYIINNSCLNHYKFLGESSRKRKIFLISRHQL